MRIFITGATGFVGRALTLRLLRDGHAVVAWTRNPEAARDVLGAEVTIASTDLDTQVGSADAVVHLAGEPVLGGRWTKHRRQRLWDSRVGLAERLVASMARADHRPGVLVSASAVGLYGDRGDEVLDEDSPPGTGFLPDLCRAWEAAATAATSLGVRVVPVRIGVVLGRGGGALGPLLSMGRWGLSGPIGSGRQWVPWIHLDDLVEMLVRAIGDPALSEPILAVAPHRVRQRDFAAAIGAALGRPAVLPTPAPVLRLALGDAASVLLDSQAVLPSRAEAIGFRYRFPTLDAALADIVDTRADLAIRPAPPDPPVGAYLSRNPPKWLLEQRVILDAPLDEVFRFFSQADNLGALTPPDLAFHVLTAPPIAMSEGTTIDYRIRLGPVPMRWRTVIEAWEPGRRFVDAQHAGPYRSWWHEHAFVADGDRTVMEDRVWYAPPVGPIGRLAHAVFIAPMLKRIFGFRTHAMRARFGLAGIDRTHSAAA